MSRLRLCHAEGHSCLEVAYSTHLLTANELSHVQAGHPAGCLLPHKCCCCLSFEDGTQQSVAWLVCIWKTNCVIFCTLSNTAGGCYFVCISKAQRDLMTKLGEGQRSRVKDKATVVLLNFNIHGSSNWWHTPGSVTLEGLSNSDSMSQS